jgi:hypothetical protein
MRPAMQRKLFPHVHPRRSVCLLTGLALLASAGCGNLNAQGFNLQRWWESKTSSPPAGAHRVATAVSASSAEVRHARTPRVSKSEAEDTDSQHQATSTDGRKAETAAEGAKKASEPAVSEQASEAPGQASKAAAQPSNANTQQNGSPADASQAASTATPPSKLPQEPPLMLSSTNEDFEERRASTIALLHRLDQSLDRINHGKLLPEVAQRRDLAVKLLQSAHAALTQHNYSEANSLARKASVIMAPLTGSVPEPAPSP